MNNARQIIHIFYHIHQLFNFVNFCTVVDLKQRLRSHHILQIFTPNIVPAKETIFLKKCSRAIIQRCLNETAQRQSLYKH